MVCVETIIRAAFTNSCQVGSIQFKVFGDSTLKMLVNNHQLAKVCAIYWCAEIQQWAYGTMTGTGSWMVTDGKKGDTYGPYKCHQWDIPDNIKSLFQEATVISYSISLQYIIHILADRRHSSRGSQYHLSWPENLNQKIDHRIWGQLYGAHRPVQFHLLKLY